MTDTCAGGQRRGAALIAMDESGAFTWTRCTGKKAYVCAATADGSLAANRVIIREAGDDKAGG